jgi:hypothetical protein
MKHLEFLKEHKKWHPYTMRHSSLDKLSRNPNVNDYILRQHAGWSKRSNMVEVYTHELRGDSVEHVMMAYGINIKDKRDKSVQQLHKEMVGPHCPFCHTVNIPDTQLCSSCHKPLTSVSYNKIMEEAEQTKGELEQLRQEQQRLYEFIKMTALKLERFDKYLMAQNAQMREEWEALPKEERDRIDKEIREEDKAAARAENQKREREH